MIERYHQLGWTLSFLVLPLPLILEQAQGQEYQPFATAMMLLAWYTWIARKPLLATSLAWTISVLANPANAFLFATFTSFALLEAGSIKKVLQKSIRLWVLSALLVLATWGPFYDQLLFADSWGVVSVMSDQLPSFSKLTKALAFLLYAALVNYLIFSLAVPFKMVGRGLQDALKGRINAMSRHRIGWLVLSILVSISALTFTVGAATHGRYYSPLLVWAALLLLLGISYFHSNRDMGRLFARWRWVGVTQLLFCVFVLALPYKYKAYARYADYFRLSETYAEYVVADTGNLGFKGLNRLENRLQHLYNLDYTQQVNDLRHLLMSGQIDQFILVYGIDVPDRALLKKVLPNEVLKAMRISLGDAGDMLRDRQFNVTMRPLVEFASGNIFLVTAASEGS